MTVREWFQCKILRRHPSFYLARGKGKSRARSGNVLICVQCGGTA